ncbi:hypothetical protein [Krasilnikovia sp. MM14-A1259]|uniref:hypothetical protein n=1 Tax=Krasilnikovia sp. MM14-A1259 TaxID=3373539 RepID=UPI0038037371
MTVESPPVDLAAWISPVCASAVDLYEVAAVLEAGGINDVTARERHGARDVFDLAGRLFRQVPPEPQPDRPVTGPWRATPVTHVLRGVVFGLPALAYLAVADRIAGPRAAVVLVVSVLLSWAAGQGLAYLGYVRLGRAGRGAAAAVLGGAGLLVALPAAAVVVALGFALGVPPAATLIAAGQLAYVLAATVALVLGREWWLLAALVPGVAAGVGVLVAGPAAGRSGQLAAAVAFSVAASAAVACWALWGVRPHLPSRAELAAALPNVAFGALAGALLIFIPAVRALDPGPDPRIGVGAALALTLPLSVSMGGAEWLLFRYRAATHRAMAETRTLRAFGWRAALALVRVTTGYLAVLVALVLAAIGLARLLTGELAAAGPVVAAVLIGPALFLALLLMSFDLRGPAVLPCLAALAANLALVPLATPESIQAITASGLLGDLFGYALVTLRRAQLHI